MKKILILILTIASALVAYAEDDIKFPFNQNPSIWFLRQGDNNFEAGALFKMNKIKENLKIEVEDSKTGKTIRVEKITAEKAEQILRSFSSVYRHWNTQPQLGDNLKCYSIFVHVDNYNWRTQISVRDSGSCELKQLLTLIGYTD